MPVKGSRQAADPREVLDETWAANDAINQLVLAHLEPARLARAALTKVNIRNWDTLWKEQGFTTRPR
jgi:hypothetical protein